MQYWLAHFHPYRANWHFSGGSGERVTPRMVILGDGDGTLRLVEYLLNREEENLRLLGVFEDDGVITAALQRVGVPWLGAVDEVFHMIRRGEVEHVVLPASWAVVEKAAPVLQRLANCPVDVRLATRFIGLCHTAHDHASFLLLQKRPIASWRGTVKSVTDYLLTLAMLAVVAAPMLLIALAIRIESPGPVLFRQRRTGFNNRDFLILKVRTMYQDATDHDVQRQVVMNDARVTRTGTMLRRTSLDDLPQLFNILAGEMSFVGPRPNVPGTRVGNRRFEEISRLYEARHCVKPSLTGLAQVRGWRGSTEQRISCFSGWHCGLEYIKNWSLWLDTAGVFRTLVAVATMRNAH